MKVLCLRTPEVVDKNVFVLDENGKIHHNVRLLEILFGSHWISTCWFRSGHDWRLHGI